MVIVPLEITFESGGRYLVGSLKLLGIALLVAVVALYSQFNAIHQAGNVSNKYIVYSLVPINVVSGTASVAAKLVAPYFQRRRAIDVSGHVTAPGDLVVVLAIGESSRRRSFSLYGYDRRNTNPVLQATRGLHLLNGIARRGSTLYALPEILEKDGVPLPLIVSRLGVPTACYVNYTLYENCAEPGETSVSNCGHGGKCYDEDVIPLLASDLSTYSSGYRFVVLHLGGGSHGPIYSDRHPPEFRLFEPMCRDADVANRCSLEELYNAYDNTILYVDFVVGEIIAELERSGVPYVFVYLSDHGESLLEGGRMFHGTPPGIPLPREQAEIPLIVKASVPIRIVEGGEYEQRDVFDTILELFSIETPVLDRSRSFIKRVGGRGNDSVATGGSVR
jgi:lipid A ethanolaminephosphotransferase